MRIVVCTVFKKYSKVAVCNHIVLRDVKRVTPAELATEYVEYVHCTNLTCKVCKQTFQIQDAE